jgi:hypothetical protein
MSNFHNPVQMQPLAVPAGLGRLLLLCRFDFRQKRWVLPAWEIPRDRDSRFFADAEILASLISQNPTDFSDPSLGGATPSKSATRRIGIRHSIQRTLGKIKTNKKKEK